MIGFDELRALTSSVGSPRVSLFVPMHKSGNEVRQNPLRFKNTLKQAEAKLKDHDAPDGFLDEARAKLADDDLSHGFWQHQEKGLAVFIEPGKTHWFKVPIDVEEGVYAGPRYHIKPLLPLLMRDGTFYILAASQDRTQLFEATRFEMTPIDDDRIPTSIAKLLGLTDYEEQVGFHPSGPTATTGGVPTAKYAGQGPSAKDYKTTELHQYAVQIGNGVDAVLGGKGRPLVIAADDKLLGMLRDEISYNDAMADGIREQPWSMTQDGLHDKAYEIARETLDASRKEVMERVEARLNDGGEGASNSVEEVVTAAVTGRVEALVVAPRAELWGVVDEQNASVRLSSLGDPQAIDLIDFAVVRTLDNGGEVFSYPLAMEQTPADVAAIFRY